MVFVPTCRTIALADSTIEEYCPLHNVFVKVDTRPPECDLTLTVTLEADSLTGLKTLVMESPTTNTVSLCLLVEGLM